MCKLKMSAFKTVFEMYSYLLNKVIIKLLTHICIKKNNNDWQFWKSTGDSINFQLVAKFSDQTSLFTSLVIVNEVFIKFILQCFTIHFIPTNLFNWLQYNELVSSSTLLRSEFSTISLELLSHDPNWGKSSLLLSNIDASQCKRLPSLILLIGQIYICWLFE